MKKKPFGSRRRTVFCVFQILFYGFQENKGVGRSSYLPSFIPPLTSKHWTKVTVVWFVGPLVYILSISLSIPSRLLDFWHTIFVSAALWDYLIIHYGDSAHIDFIPWYASHAPWTWDVPLLTVHYAAHQDPCSRFRHIMLYPSNDLVTFSQLTIFFTVCSDILQFSVDALCLFQAVITFLVHWYIFLSNPHQSLSSLLGAVFLCTEYTNVSRGIVFFF